MVFLVLTQLSTIQEPTRLELIQRVESTGIDSLSDAEARRLKRLLGLEDVRSANAAKLAEQG